VIGAVRSLRKSRQKSLKIISVAVNVWVHIVDFKEERITSKTVIIVESNFNVGKNTEIVTNIFSVALNAMQNSRKVEVL
jgi:hypothetical protein